MPLGSVGTVGALRDAVNAIVQISCQIGTLQYIDEGTYISCAWFPESPRCLAQRPLHYSCQMSQPVCRKCTWSDKIESCGALGTVSIALLAGLSS